MLSLDSKTPRVFFLEFCILAKTYISTGSQNSWFVVFRRTNWRSLAATDFGGKHLFEATRFGLGSKLYPNYNKRMLNKDDTFSAVFLFSRGV